MAVTISQLMRTCSCVVHDYSTRALSATRPLLSCCKSRTAHALTITYRVASTSTCWHHSKAQLGSPGGHFIPCTSNKKLAIGLAKEITEESRTTLRGKNSSYDLHILTWLSRKLKLIQPRSLQTVMISERTGYILLYRINKNRHTCS